MNANTKAAVIGGLAATFVVAVSLAPRMVGGTTQVQVRPAAVEATVPAPEPVAVLEPVAVATAAPTAPAAAKPVEDRVTKVEQRVDVLEATTTTTMPTCQADENLGYQNGVPTCVRVARPNTTPTTSPYPASPPVGAEEVTPSS